MIIGTTDIPVQELIILIFIVLSLIFNTFLFFRGHSSYSVKNQLMRKHKFFRVHQIPTNIIEIFYKSFFLLPIILMIVIAILRATKGDWKQFISVIFGGSVIMLAIYPIKNIYFYHKLFASWILVFILELVTLIMYLWDRQSLFVQLSVIFYTLNAILLCYAFLANQKIYWSISEPIAKFPDKVKQVNQKWNESIQNIPKIFDGGIYGFFNRNYPQYIFLALYLISFAVLIAYALLVWFADGSSLGFIGLISNTVYDIFVSAFSALKQKQRTIRSLFVVIFFGRLMSFVFGKQLWLVGYCLLYLVIGIFIGQIIVDRRLPLKFQSKSKGQHNHVNALKTPQFVFVLLTVLIAGLMIASEIFQLSPIILYNEQNFNLWKITLLVVFLTWIIIFYSVSQRLMRRNMNNISQNVEYYFGSPSIHEYHISFLLTYVMIIGTGGYFYYFTLEANAFIGFIFLPLIYMIIMSLWVNWVKNDYQLLADIDEYNKKMKKQYDAEIKKEQVIFERNKKLQDSNAKGQRIQLRRMSQIHAHPGKAKSKFSTFRNMFSIDNFASNDRQQKQPQESNLTILQNKDKVIAQTQKDDHESQFHPAREPFQQLKNWRDPSLNISVLEIFECLTPNDFQIMIYLLLLVLMLIAITVTSFFWGKSDIGLSFTLTLISFLFLVPYYRCVKCGNQIYIWQLIIGIIGFLIGIVYWSVFHAYIWGPLIWGFLYLIISGFFVAQAFANNLQIKIRVILMIKMALCLALICVIFALHFSLLLMIVTLIIILITIIGLVTFYMVLKLNSLPLWGVAIIGIFIFLCVAGLAIGGYLLDALSDFALFSLVMVILEIGVLATCAVIYLKKLSTQYDIPHVYSAYAFPVYRFDSSKEQLKLSQNQLIIFQIAMGLLIAYVVVVALGFNQKQYSIYTSSIYLIMQFYVYTIASIISYYNIGMRKKELTDQLMLESLTQLIEKYMIDETQGEDSPYYISKLQEKYRQLAEKGNDENGQIWRQIVYYQDLIVKNKEQEEKFLFFWIVLIDYHLKVKSRQKMLEFISELKQIEQELLEDGIFLKQINCIDPPEQKFEKLTKEIQSLSPVDFIILQEILSKHRAQKQQKKEVLDEIHRKEQQKNIQKDNQLFQKMKEEIKTGKEEIDKFKALVSQLGKKGLYVDQQFPASQQSLGTAAQFVQEWRRPSVGETLIRDGINASDVKQGSIGDCYLISSFAVLGQKRILSCLGIENGNQLWTNKKGAYMVRFYKFLKEVYITIDDQLPVNDQSQWAFAKSQDPSQFWPAILEKAYAKLYSGYDKIIQGKCHKVMSQFTGGFPFQIILEKQKNNPNGLWNKIITSKQSGYLLSAGTPMNPQGDKASSKRGIVQGHAYAILNARQVEGYKLIKLKNPHGSQGKQWIGDFSDGSQLLTKRMMGLLQHSQSNDGIFWMPLEDFIYEFKSLYICAIFDDRWKKIDPVQSNWNEENSFGTPNISAQTFKNPQFGLTVTKPCIVFINLTQQAISALKGKNYIYLRVQRNNGKRIHQQDLISDRLCGIPQRPVNSVSLSTQISLQADSYPYTFTILACCQKQGDTGKFTLQIYCNDLNAKLIDDKDFDRWQ